MSADLHRQDVLAATNGNFCRPYLLRKRDVNNQYRYSREAAIESAKADLLGRRAFMFEKPEDTKVNSGGYRV